MKKRVYIDKAGCNRRLLELERIRTYLSLNDYAIVPRADMANVILIATCAFKKKEEDEAINRLEVFDNRYSAEKIVLGCLPDIAPKRYERFAHIPKIAPRELDEIDQYFMSEQHPFDEVSDAHLLYNDTPQAKLRSLWRNVKTTCWYGTDEVGDLLHKLWVEGRLRLSSRGSKKSAFYYLLVSRGCLGRCSYCAIRKSIGTVKSTPPDILRENFLEGLRAGYRDIVIIADDPGCYGVDIDSSLPDLLEVLAEGYNQFTATDTAAVDIRLHVREIHPKFLIAYRDRLAIPNDGINFASLLCPIQSGSDRILASMHREHTIGELLDALAGVKSMNEGLELTTQIIVGFPGETDDDLRMTMDMVKAGGFSSVVVFPYDDKQGTAASGLADKIPHQVVRKKLRRVFRYFRENGIKASYSCAP